MCTKEKSWEENRPSGNLLFCQLGHEWMNAGCKDWLSFCHCHFPALYCMFHVHIRWLIFGSWYSTSFLSFSSSLLLVMSSFSYKKAFQKPFGSLSQFRTLSTHHTFYLPLDFIEAYPSVLSTSIVWSTVI